MDSAGHFCHIVMVWTTILVSLGNYILIDKYNLDVRVKGQQFFQAFRQSLPATAQNIRLQNYLGHQTPS